jgi:hypothetical protein
MSDGVVMLIDWFDDGISRDARQPSSRLIGPLPGFVPLRCDDTQQASDATGVSVADGAPGLDPFEPKVVRSLFTDIAAVGADWKGHDRYLLMMWPWV